MNVPTATGEVSLDYVAEGRPDGVPVVFLHGFTDSRLAFSRVLTWMSGAIYAVAVSQRGHGDSDRPETGYSPSDFAADIARLMDRLELPEAVIVGHSMGATVAQRFALDFPELTSGLVLAGSFFKFKDNPGGMDLWDSTVSRMNDPVDPVVVRDFQVSTMKKRVPNAFLHTVVGESLKVPARVWKAALRGLIEADFTGELGNIRVPTMLLWGDQDLFVSRNEQDQLLAAISGSTLKVYPGTGHAPHWEDPARFAGDIADFALSCGIPAVPQRQSTR